MGLRHHLWTIGPRLAHAFSPVPCPDSSPWSAVVEDPRFGPVRLSGRLTERASDDLLVIVHGLGGCCDSHYARRAAAAAERAGLASFRINLRGSDRNGDDFYHAGLTSDLAVALASPELAPYRRILLLGYSLGGHVALRFAAVESVPRLAAVAAVCAPVDLARSGAAIDRPALAVYKRYLLTHLKEIYAPVAARHAELPRFDEVRAVRTIREWDERVVAPRHGFANAADYYARASVAPLLDDLAAPTLIVASQGDPMVPAATVEPVLRGRERPGLAIHWLRRAGHCGFPRGVDLRLETDRPETAGSLERQVIDWLIARGRSPRARRSAP